MATQAQDRAILRVSYLLATLDGTVSDEEKRLFRKVGDAYSWFAPGNQETNELIDDVVLSSEKLLRLKGFYSEQEFLTAFMTEVEANCKTIKSSKAVTRKAFAIWIAMCLADRDFSAIERCAVKLLQQRFNGGDSLTGLPITYDKLPKSVALGIAGLLVGSVGGAAVGYWAGKAVEKNQKGKAANEKTVISDEFLKATEDDCVILGNLLEQIESAKTPAEKSKLENAYKMIEADLHARISENSED